MKCGKTLIERERLVKIQCDFPCMTLYGICLIYLGKYLVHATLDCWILLQNCKNTLPWCTVDQLVKSAENGTLYWLEGINCVKIRTHCKTLHLMAQHGERRIYILKVEL